MIQDFVVITGFSGAGKSQAMATFEDAGYFCVDNLPPEMISSLADLFGHEGSKVEHAAVASDTRGGGYFESLVKVLEELEARGVPFRLLFLGERRRLITASGDASPSPRAAASAESAIPTSRGPGAAQGALGRLVDTPTVRSGCARSWRTRCSLARQDGRWRHILPSLQALHHAHPTYLDVRLPPPTLRSRARDLTGLDAVTSTPRPRRHQEF